MNQSGGPPPGASLLFRKLRGLLLLCPVFSLDDELLVDSVLDRLAEFTLGALKEAWTGP